MCYEMKHECDHVDHNQLEDPLPFIINTRVLLTSFIIYSCFEKYVFLQQLIECFCVPF